MARRNDKRIRLVNAAKQLFRERGVNVTTLANIASLADVPLGNVYYYFQSKEAIIRAVVEVSRKEVEELLQGLETAHADPRTRLSALIACNEEQLADLVAYGDSLGGLCQELAKEGGEASDQASDIMKQLIAWSAQQFEAMGKINEHAKQLALSLISNLQGARLLALTFKDPTYVTRQNDSLTQWISTL